MGEKLKPFGVVGTFEATTIGDAFERLAQHFDELARGVDVPSEVLGNVSIVVEELVTVGFAHRTSGRRSPQPHA